MSTTVGGPPVSNIQNESVNGRNSTIPAIPSSAINGNQPFGADHSRNPSMTVTPAGATSFNTNGALANKPNIQFGSANAGNPTASPALGTPHLAQQSAANLGVNQITRGASPHNSPSPIPQPGQVSGGRPPSSATGSSLAMNFGQLGLESPDTNGMNRSMSHLQTSHDRRGSSQSIHSDVGGPGMPQGPNRTFSGPGGRGRGGYGNYSNQPQFSPHQQYRNNQNGRGSYQGRQYQGSPSLQPRTPMMNNAVTPQMAQMHMVPGMQGQPYYNPQYQGYPQTIPVAADPSLAYAYHNYYQQDRNYPGYVAPQSPRQPVQQPGYSANMQPSLSMQGYQPPSMSRQSSQMSTTDPSISVQTPHTPASVPLVTGRTPSMSEKAPFERPKKSQAIPIKNALGEVLDFKKQSSPASPAPTPVSTGPASIPIASTPPSRTPSAADNSHNRTESISMKNDDDKKRAMQAAVAKKIAEAKEEAEKARKQKEAEEEKVQMDKEAAEAAEREAQAKKEEAERLEAEKQAAEEKRKRLAEEAAKEKEAEAARQAEAAKQAETVRQAEAAKAKEAEAAKAKEGEAAKVKEVEAAKAKEVEAAKQAEAAKEAEAIKQAEAAKEKSAPAAKADDNEIDFDALAAEMEAEELAREAEDRRREEEYTKRKAAEKESQRKREKEAADAYEANMKEMERKAEEEELAREQKRAEGSASDSEAKKIFASLKAGGATPATADESEAQTPGDSGAVTPVSDTSMPPPAKGMAPGRRGKATDLILDTKKSVEPPEPSATLKSLTSAKFLDDPNKVQYPDGIVSPSPALNANATSDRKFKYNKEFLLQFQSVFKEKPSLDWDQRMREVLGDGDSARPQTARTPSGMGGRSASNRPSAANAFGPMGAFGNNKNPLPTSEQRFAQSTAALRGAPMAANPFNFGRPSNMGPPMGRSPSNNPMGAIPGSPRPGQPSRGGSRAESKRAKQSAKQETDANKNMPLTAGMSITLETSGSGWKPRSLQSGAPAVNVGPDGYMEADVVQRKVKAALNKMTPEKFDRISDQVLEIASQSKHESDGRTLRQVIQLTFEKATDEAHWASMYAKFCFKMLSNMSNDIKDENIKDKAGNVVVGGNLFRKYLLNRCQEEFERGWKVNLPPQPEGVTEEAAMLSDEYYIAATAKRRGLGLVKFIGELFKLGMLTERIMHECVKKLLDYEGTPDEAEVESLSSLLRTIGRQLDSPESKAAGRMEAYFERIMQTLQLPDLPSRLRFMLMDVVDLRKSGWNSKDADKGPKTITQIHEEAEKAARDAEMQRLASQSGGRGGGRMPMGRGDARSFSSYGQVPPPDNSNRVGADDLRRLGGRTARQNIAPSGSFGPSSMGQRTNSGRRGLGPALRPEDSNASSRTGTPPAQREKEKKDESSMNAFSALAGLDSHDGATSPPPNASSPPTQKSQPAGKEGPGSLDKKNE